MNNRYASVRETVGGLVHFCCPFLFFPSSYRKSPIAASCLIVLRIDRFDVHFMCNLNHFTVKKLQLFLRTIIGSEF